MTSNQYLDASAVVSFFLMTGKKHLFLTGGRGSGKSFLCRAISQKLAAGQARPFSHLLSQKRMTTGSSCTRTSSVRTRNMSSESFLLTPPPVEPPTE